MDRPFPAYQGDEPYIFVSYAHEDNEVVFPEIQWLHEQGFNIWYDEGISPGSEWHQELADRIQGSSLFLYLITPQSVSSEHCQREVHFAIDHGKQLLAVHLEETELPGGVDLSLSSIQAIMRHELSDFDYRIKLLKGTSDHIQRGIGAVSEPVPQKPGSNIRILSIVCILTALVTGIIVSAITMWNPGTKELAASHSLKRLEIRLSGTENPEPALRGWYGKTLGVTADGTRFYFAGYTPTGVQLYSRSFNELDAAPIQGTSGTDTRIQFQLSKDGEWLLFSDTSSIKKVRSVGGTPITVADTTNYSDLAWGPDNTIVFRTNRLPGLWQISAMGGTRQRLTAPEEGTSHRQPFYVPDGDVILFTIIHGYDTDNAQIASLSLRSGKQKVLMQGTAPHSTASGHLIFLREGALWAVAYDWTQGELIGEALPVIDGIYSMPEYAPYSVSLNGTLIYWHDRAKTSSELVWVDREGNQEAIPMNPGLISYPRLSPGQDQIALTISPRGSTYVESDIWIYTPTRNTSMRLTFERGWEGMPEWSPDGQQIVFASERDGSDELYDLFTKASDGTGEQKRLTDSPNRQFPTFWSANGQQILFMELTPEGPESNLKLLSVQDEPKIEFLSKSEKREAYGVLSPDSKWIAYESDESGQIQVYVRPFPEMDTGRWQISTTGGKQPKWGSDGQEIFYWGSSHMMVVPVEIEPTFRPGNARELFELDEYQFSVGRNYDIAVDGQRFLMVKSVREANMVVVFNWFDELERLVPTK